jgi:penicillin amidase
MRRLRGLLAIVLAALLVVTTVGIGGLAWTTARALPQTSGTLAIAGLEGEVTVVRDAAGIAHITAATPHDLFLGQGFVHAQERMYQMEIWRHISSGRLSELFGESTLDTDRFIRTLGWRPAAERDLAVASPAARAALDAYAAGVNAYLEQKGGDLGLAFLASGARPEPWTPLDSIAWQKVQAWNLGGNFDLEIFRLLADAMLGDPDRTDELFPPYREGAPVITPSLLAGVRVAPRPAGPPPGGSVTPAAALSGPERSAWREVAGLGDGLLRLAGLDGAAGLAGDHGIGSNEWVVAPSRSASGGALLANDPHLGISMPSVWFINGLHCREVSEACPFDVAGVSFPGVPAVVLGHNARIAWGATNVDPDVQDLYIERLDPADPNRYMSGDRSLPLTTRREEIRVNGAESVILDVRSTGHGPILNDVDPRLTDAPPLALRWTATSEPDRTFDALLGLNTAADFDAFRATLSLYGSPAQNFVYADVDGHIGYQLPGAIPVRADPADDGERPRLGDSGVDEWVGRIPYEDLPWQLDPEEGWIVTANNAPVDDGYPHLLGSEREWDPGYRAERILDELVARAEDGLTADDLHGIQMDTTIGRGRDAMVWLEGSAPTTDDGRTLVARILDWDGSCDVDSLGCAAYNAWEYRLLRGLFDDDLGELARDYVGAPPSWVLMTQLMDEPESPWWDDVTTPSVEGAAHIVARALDEAGAELRAAYGEPDSWTWGRLHTATFREGTLGASGIGPLEWYFNAGPHPVAGAAGAVDNTYYRFTRAYPDPEEPETVPVGIDTVFDVTNLPSYRLTIDMSDLDGARLVTTTGQSGNPFDRHYGDLIDPWRTGGTVPLPFTAGGIEAAAVATLTLTP